MQEKLLVLLEWMQSNFLYQEADVISLEGQCIIVRCFVSRNYDNVITETGKLSNDLVVSGVHRMF